MKDLVIKKPFGQRGTYFVTQEKGDVEDHCLQYFDRKLSILITIYPGGITDGGSTGVAEVFFDELLAPTAHGYIFHDELWNHRVLLANLFKEVGLTFTETNRIMRAIHKEAGATWAEQNLTRFAVRWLGWWRWGHPNKHVRSLGTPTITIERKGAKA